MVMGGLDCRISRTRSAGVGRDAGGREMWHLVAICTRSPSSPIYSPSVAAAWKHDIVVTQTLVARRGLVVAIVPMPTYYSCDCALDAVCGLRERLESLAPCTRFIWVASRQR